MKLLYAAILSVIAFGVSYYVQQYFEPSNPEKHLNTGLKAQQQGDFVGAFNACEAGIEALGNRYIDANLIDDSGQKVSAAYFAQRDGDLAVAASLMCGVLASRIEIMRAN